MSPVEYQPITPVAGTLPADATPEVVGFPGEDAVVAGVGVVSALVLEESSEDAGTSVADASTGTPPLAGGRTRRRGRRLVAPEAVAAAAGPKQLSPEQRLLVLDTWNRSGLPAGDFAEIVGVAKHTLYAWKQRFEAEGPAGLMPHQRGPGRGSRLPELTRRTALMLKQAHPDWGVQRISDELARGPGLAASASAVGKVLHDAGYELVQEETRPHPDKVREFERATPNQLWQSDLFTFMLKRQNQRVHLVAFLDDHSRFIVSYGLHASQSAALVVETFKAGITSYGAPQEMLTDNGAQYVTWRGTSQFAHECQRRGVKHIVATPRRPQTLGKTERFWGTLWREMLEVAVFTDLNEARQRIGLFIDHYNFQRPHQGIGGLVPADRFFAAAPQVRKTLQERLAANALELSRSGVPKAPLYLAGNLGGQPLSLHGEGDQVVLQHNGQRTVIALTPPASGTLPQPVAGAVASAAPPPLPPEPAMPTPQAPVAAVASPWTGAVEQAPGVSALDALGVPASGTIAGMEVRS
jgi:transposase InsO family protein